MWSGPTPWRWSLLALAVPPARMQPPFPRSLHGSLSLSLSTGLPAAPSLFQSRPRPRWHLGLSCMYDACARSAPQPASSFSRSYYIVLLKSLDRKPSRAVAALLLLKPSPTCSSALSPPSTFLETSTSNITDPSPTRPSPLGFDSVPVWPASTSRLYNSSPALCRRWREHSARNTPDGSFPCYQSDFTQAEFVTEVT